MFSPFWQLASSLDAVSYVRQVLEPNRQTVQTAQTDTDTDTIEDTTPDDTTPVHREKWFLRNAWGNRAVSVGCFPKSCVNSCLGFLPPLCSVNTPVKYHLICIGQSSSVQTAIGGPTDVLSTCVHVRLLVALGEPLQVNIVRRLSVLAFPRLFFCGSTFCCVLVPLLSCPYGYTQHSCMMRSCAFFLHFIFGIFPGFLIWQFVSVGAVGSAGHVDKQVVKIEANGHTVVDDSIDADDGLDEPEKPHAVTRTRAVGGHLLRGKEAAFGELAVVSKTAPGELNSACTSGDCESELRCRPNSSVKDGSSSTCQNPGTHRQACSATGDCSSSHICFQLEEESTHHKQCLVNNLAEGSPCIADTQCSQSNNRCGGTPKKCLR